MSRRGGSLPAEVDGVKVSLYELMYRGRSCSKLADKASKRHWREFTECPYEDFANQERVHIDLFGYVHVCRNIHRECLAETVIKNNWGVRSLR